jgi:hypothetical protein
MGMRRRGRGEGSIVQRADGRWMARVDLGWQDGKRHSKAIYGRTRRVVADGLRDALKAAQDGTLVGASVRPFPNPTRAVEARTLCPDKRLQYSRSVVCNAVASTEAVSTNRPPSLISSPNQPSLLVHDEQLDRVRPNPNPSILAEARDAFDVG